MRVRRVLYFCSSNLAVIDDGIKKINCNLLKEFLKQGFKVTLILPLGSGSVPSDLAGVKIIFYNKKNSLINKFKSLLLARPLYFGMYFDRKIFNNVNKLDFEMIFYDFYPLTQYSSGLKNEIFMMPDSMKELMWSGFKNEKNFLRKTYSFANYFLAVIYNKKIKKIKKLYVSKEDIKKDNLLNSFFFKIPANLNTVSKYLSIKSNGNEILFRGGMEFEPNMTAVDDFYHEIFLDLINDYPDINLKIVGRLPNETYQQKICKNTVYTGFVDDINQVMSESALHIVPMKSGTGVKTKLLDSIALKRLVFCTPMSINGVFESVDEARESGIIVYANAKEFRYYYEMYQSKKLKYTEMTNKAYDFIKRNSYSLKIEELIEISKQEIQ
ncbi:glycosyltransferase family 4 protein [Candidatus Pseudothioglobus singularis]|nr:glycosyltransferase family 4 protein [Candidatus Pseudothioglobus singularis]